MAGIKTSFSPHQNLPTKPLVKYVKKAGLWVTTTFENNKQVQKWTESKPE